MSELILFFVVAAVAETIYLMIIYTINKRKKSSLQKECAIWDEFVNCYINRGKKIDQKVYEEMIDIFEKKKNAEIVHAKCIVAADLDSYKVATTIFTLIQLVIPVFCKITSWALVRYALRVAETEYANIIDASTDILQIFFFVIVIVIIYPLMKECIKEKYFIGILENYLMEKAKIDAKDPIKEVEKRVNSLEAEVSSLKRMRLKKRERKIVGYYITLDK